MIFKAIIFLAGSSIGFMMGAFLGSSIANRRLESIARIHELAKPNCFETCGCGNCKTLKEISKICQDEAQ